MAVAEPEESGEKPLAPGGQQAPKRWAALTKHVCEVGPSSCPKWAAEMNICPPKPWRMWIIAFIEGRQRAVMEKILKHCGVWKEVSSMRAIGIVLGRWSSTGHPEPLQIIGGSLRYSAGSHSGLPGYARIWAWDSFLDRVAAVRQIRRAVYASIAARPVDDENGQTVPTRRH